MDPQIPHTPDHNKKFNMPCIEDVTKLLKAEIFHPACTEGLPTKPNLFPVDATRLAMHVHMGCTSHLNLVVATTVPQAA